jgi:O-succinylbenzoate synthase
VYANAMPTLRRFSKLHARDGLLVRATASIVAAARGARGILPLSGMSSETTRRRILRAKH